MKKIIYGLLATMTGVVLLFSYRTSLDAVAPTASTGGPIGVGSAGGSSDTGGNPSSQGSTAGGSTPPSASASASASSSSLKDGSYTGQTANTDYGPVQVQITVSGGTITKVAVPQYPTESFRDQQINQRAVPTLVSETLHAQSAKIDMVSGATYTSNGYLQSLQSALDGARA